MTKYFRSNFQKFPQSWKLWSHYLYSIGILLARIFDRFSLRGKQGFQFVCLCCTLTNKASSIKTEANGQICNNSKQGNKRNSTLD